MKKRKLSAARRHASIVKLNVGGKSFHTTAETLSHCDYFKPVIDGRLEHGTDEHGRLFIDRSPQHFAIPWGGWHPCREICMDKTY